MREYTVVPEGKRYGIAIKGRIVIHELDKRKANAVAKQLNKGIKDDTAMA